MKARYHLQIHCLDDAFRGPAEVEVEFDDEKLSATVLLKKNREAGPGIIDLYIDFKIDIDDISEEEGVLIPPDKIQELQKIGLYVADVLAYQTGLGEIQGNLDVVFKEAFSEFIPENEEEERFIEAKRRRLSKSLTMQYRIYGGNLIRVNDLKNLCRHRDAIACYAEAMRLKHPISVYRELYRIIEYFFARPGMTKKKTNMTKKKTKTKLTGRDKFIERASDHLSRFDQKYDFEFLKELTDLRDRCSHTNKNYITPNDTEGLEELRKKIPELQKIAKILIDNPPY